MRDEKETGKQYIRTFVSRIRKAIGKDVLESIEGVGFRLNYPVVKACSSCGEQVDWRRGGSEDAGEWVEL
jgi:hypothetical protein